MSVARAVTVARWLCNVAGFQNTRSGRIEFRGVDGVLAQLKSEREPRVVTTGDVQNISVRGARVRTSVKLDHGRRLMSHAR